MLCCVFVLGVDIGAALDELGRDLPGVDRCGRVQRCDAVLGSGVGARARLDEYDGDAKMTKRPLFSSWRSEPPWKFIVAGIAVSTLFLPMTAGGIGTLTAYLIIAVVVYVWFRVGRRHQERIDAGQRMRPARFILMVIAGALTAPLSLGYAVGRVWRRRRG